MPISDTDFDNRGGAPFKFFVLVFLLSLPFWAVGAAIGGELMPGLPLAGLMVVCPALAALLMRPRPFAHVHIIDFVSGALDVQRLRAPFVIVLLLINPGLFGVSYLIQQHLGHDLPPPDIALLPALGLFGVFLIAALCEELGWTGYALEPLQRRWGALRASLVIGSVWAVWHFFALAQAGRSVEWIAWWTLWTLTARALMVWLYNHMGQSVFGISLYHASSNVCWQTFPVHGSHFDPRISALVTLAVAIAVIRPWKRARPRPSAR